MSSRSFRWRPRQALVWWTSGKDSAWTLHLLQQDPAWDVRGLIAPVSETNGRALLHGVCGEMLERQAAALGLPLQLVQVDWTTSQARREALYQQALSAARAEGMEFVAFADISSAQRRERLSLGIGRTGMEAVFPLWGRDSREHAKEVLDAGVSSWSARSIRASFRPNSPAVATTRTSWTSRRRASTSRERTTSSTRSWNGRPIGTIEFR